MPRHYSHVVAAAILLSLDTCFSPLCFPPLAPEFLLRPSADEDSLGETGAERAPAVQRKRRWIAVGSSHARPYRRMQEIDTKFNNEFSRELTSSRGEAFLSEGIIRLIFHFSPARVRGRTSPGRWWRRMPPCATATWPLQPVPACTGKSHLLAVSSFSCISTHNLAHYLSCSLPLPCATWGSWESLAPLGSNFSFDVSSATFFLFQR